MNKNHIAKAIFRGGLLGEYASFAVAKIAARLCKKIGAVYETTELSASFTQGTT